VKEVIASLGNTLNQNPLDFIERDLVTRAIIELRRPWRPLSCNRLSILDIASAS